LETVAQGTAFIEELRVHREEHEKHTDWEIRDGFIDCITLSQKDCKVQENVEFRRGFRSKSFPITDYYVISLLVGTACNEVFNSPRILHSQEK
jgi:hypothetical protein